MNPAHAGFQPGARCTTLTGFGAALLLACAGVSAQEQPAPPPQADLEQIFVTGSRIARPDFESASPIVSITSEAFERTSNLSVESVVSKLPQFTPDMGSSSNNPGNGGQSNLQLRGLGATSTLVLLDGRRIIPANGNGVVDVNIIPPSLVESVEVVTGGASAVYGSDAIAGVANFKLKEKFSGLQLDASSGISEHGDANEYSLGLTGGLEFAEGRGQAFGYVGYSQRDSLSQSERTFSEVSVGYFGPGNGTVGPGNSFRPSGSAMFIPDGRTVTTPDQVPSRAAFDSLFATYGFSNVQFRGNSLGFNADGTLFTTGTRIHANSVVNYRGAQDPYLANDRVYTYNFAPYNYLQLPLERESAFGRASYEIGPGATLYAQVLYAGYTAAGAAAPATVGPIYLPRSNPYVPADYALLLDSRIDASADIQIYKRFVEFGPRQASTDHDSAQLTAGVRGDVLGDWKYDVYVQSGTYDASESQAGLTLLSRIMELTYAPDGGVAACGGLNVFGPNSISTRCASYLSLSATNKTDYDQDIAEATLTGSPWSMPAGEVGIAVGMMYKRDKFAYRSDPLSSRIVTINGNDEVDLQGFNASKDAAGEDHNTDAYVEALIPLAKDLPGVVRLDAGLGYRHSEYASAGGADSYKAELMYEPVQPLRIRSSYQHAVRAPSIFELYEPQLPAIYGSEDDGFGGVPDPCTAGSPQRTAHPAQVAALCLAQGLPANLLPTFADGDGLHRGVVGGNPDLGPETADTVTVGFALQSWSSRPAFTSMQVSVDWYRIKMDDAIAQLTADIYIPLCFDSRTNPDFSASHALCQMFSRNTVNGEIVNVQDLNRNLVGFEVSGIDTQFDWSIPAGPGAVKFNVLASWMQTYDVTQVAGLPAEDELGLVGAFLGQSRPDWKWNVNLGYDWGGAQVSTQWRYISAMRDFQFREYAVPAFEYVDAFASYEFSGSFTGLTVRAGIENIADKQPPLLPSAVAANTDPSQYDLLGRRYSVSASYRF